jgi:hydroxyacylglutathione hydrolase
MYVERIPALLDNYIFLLVDRARQEAAVVDPAEAQPVLDRLAALNCRLTTIFNTHHHRDHVGGTPALLQAFPELVVYGGARDRGRIPAQQVFLEGGETIPFADRTAQVFFVPGHTRAHVAYYFAPANGPDSDGWGDLFSGDVIFGAGCGRLFEGTPAEMLQSIDQLRQLPDSTRIWCAHEYTLGNLEFAQTIEPQNPALQQRLQETRLARSHQQPTVPLRLGQEKQTNPFLRWDSPAVQAAMATDDPVRTFARLRGKKDLW